MSTYVLDAPVAISALRAGDANHARAGYAPADARRAADLFVGPARTVTIGPRAARAASMTASRARLRTGDAIYVWVAAREAMPLLTLDAEILSRAHLAGVTTFAP